MAISFAIITLSYELTILTSCCYTQDGMNCFLFECTVVIRVDVTEGVANPFITPFWSIIRDDFTMTFRIMRNRALIVIIEFWVFCSSLPSVSWRWSTAASIASSRARPWDSLELYYRVQGVVGRVEGVRRDGSSYAIGLSLYEPFQKLFLLMPTGIVPVSPQYEFL